MREFICLSLLGLVMAACSAQNAPNQQCSSVKAVQVPGTILSQSIESGEIPLGWGGVLDLLEHPEKPETSTRQRCTVHMDYIPTPSGGTVNPNRIAFWTAEHCLRWQKAGSAELSLFDKSSKKYIRLPIQLDELERFKVGKELFSRLKPDMLQLYLNASDRPEMGIVERGAPVCKTDTGALQLMDPSLGVVCSTVLDLARIEGTISPSVQGRPDVADVLGRMRAEIEKIETDQFQKADLLNMLDPSVDKVGLIYWLTHWRSKVSLITKWRGYEGMASIIDQVRLCNDGESSGLCNQEFRDFFSVSLTEYEQLKEPGETYPAFLLREVNRPMTATSHNLQWLLYSQKNIQKAIGLAGQASFGTNLLRKTPLLAPQESIKTLGNSGPTYYSVAGLNLLSAGLGSSWADQMFFNDKTILFKYKKNLINGETFLLQPGDSGTVALIGNMPVGVVSTVNGKETSGGTSVLPLPEYDANAEETVSVGGARKQSKPLSCK
jgi:hypothetical protein